MDNGQWSRLFRGRSASGAFRVSQDGFQVETFLAVNQTPMKTSELGSYVRLAHSSRSMGDGDRHGMSGGGSIARDRASKPDSVLSTTETGRDNVGANV